MGINIIQRAAGMQRQTSPIKSSSSASSNRNWAVSIIILSAALLSLPAAFAAPTLPVTSGLRLKLAADLIDPNNAAEVTVVGGVQQLKLWRDQSGNNFNATQATTSRQPVYVPNALFGKPVIKFDGINDCLVSSLAQFSGNKSIFVVHKRINLTTIPSGTEVSSSTSGKGLFLGNNGGNESKGRISVAHDLQLPGLVNDYVFKAYIRSGTSETLYVNDGVSTVTAADAPSGTFTISDQNSFPYSGAIAEVLIYNRAVTEAERQLIENYLSEKWYLWTPSLTVRNGLEMWLSADGINHNAPDQVVQRNGGYFLTRWQSRAPVYRNAYQTTAASQPQVILNGFNGRPVVRFDGVNDYMTTAMPLIVGNKTIFTVHKRTSSSFGLEISSTSNMSSTFLGSDGGTNEAKGRFSNGRTNLAYDLQVPMALNQFVMKKFMRNGTAETLDINGNSATNPNVSFDPNSGNYSISDGFNTPFTGDIAEMLIYNRAVSAAESDSILDYLQDKWSWTADNVYSATADLTPPPMVTSAPAPGLRVKQTTPAYAGTNVYHTLYLPTNWQAGQKYPVIVEYPPNGPFQGAYGDSDSGKVDDIAMGYGITGGTGYILVGVSPIAGNPATNQLEWWGNVAATKDYCLQTVRYVCEQFGGDPSAVILAGFSRGAIACNYLGLNDDNIADVWLGFIAHSHYDGQIDWGYEASDAASALTRLLRLKGRNQHLSHETFLDSAESYLASTGVSMTPFSFRTLPYGNHTDQWALRPLQLRRDVRAWLQQVVQNKPGTHLISGRVTSNANAPLAGVRIQSGYTHFTFTAADGTYQLPGIIDSTRTISATLTGRTFTDRVVIMAGSNLTNINFKSTQ